MTTQAAETARDACEAEARRAMAALVRPTYGHRVERAAELARIDRLLDAWNEASGGTDSRHHD